MTPAYLRFETRALVRRQRVPDSLPLRAQLGVILHRMGFPISPRRATERWLSRPARASRVAPLDLDDPGLIAVVGHGVLLLGRAEDPERVPVTRLIGEIQVQPARERP